MLVHSLGDCLDEQNRDVAVCILRACYYQLVVFFNDTATAEIYTLSLHDALPISRVDALRDELPAEVRVPVVLDLVVRAARQQDRKRTRLNSSHANISYAAFCLKKKRTATPATHTSNQYTAQSPITHQQTQVYNYT